MNNHLSKTECHWMLEVIDELRDFARKSGLKNSELELGLLTHTLEAELTALSLLQKDIEEASKVPKKKGQSPHNCKIVFTDLKSANKNGPNSSSVLT